MQSLIIVESPTKAKTITKLLEGKFKVVSSMGHIKDLPKSKLGVDIENGFIPYYIIIRGKKDIIKKLKEEAKKADYIFLGTDPDREGEAIAFHIAEEIKKEGIKRVRFYEITKEGILRALGNPGEIDENLVSAHKARRVLDRLVGYLVSPLLWRIFHKGLSAGRVQTVALRLVVEREKEREKFEKTPYWVCKAVFEKDGYKFPAELFMVEEKRKEKFSEEEKREFEKNLKKEVQGIVKEYKKIMKRFSPSPPYITSTMQQDASIFLGFSPKQTMMIAQRLFEGVEIEGGPVGLITYMRTDSVRVNREFIERTRRFIRNVFGEDYLPSEGRTYQDKKGAQGAHEAIRPTYAERTPERIKNYLMPEQYKLYDLIYRRYLASQMEDSRYEEKTVQIRVSNFYFLGRSLKKIFDGFEKVFLREKKETDYEIPELSLNDRLRILEIKWEKRYTQPPPRYTEASLVKKLEKHGIGRPSTYAPIISTLFERNYIEKRDGKIVPTSLGRKVAEILIPRFATLFDLEFTKKMEESLDLVAEGQKKWQEVVKEFYLPFSETLKKFEKEIPELKENHTIYVDEKCPKCGSPLIVKWGKYGRFIACSAFPKCDYTKPFEIDKKCPICGSSVYEIRGKKKKNKTYYKCSNPSCNFITDGSITDEKCPECSSFLIQRGRRFYCVRCKKYVKGDK